mgnify:CR=1 FL=1
MNNYKKSQRLRGYKIILENRSLTAITSSRLTLKEANHDSHSAGHPHFIGDCTYRRHSGSTHHIGWSLTEGWVALSIALYILTGLFWLPVVWIQIRLRDLAAKASCEDQPLPAAYHRLFGIWLVCGIPAFTAVLAIIWLMLVRPTIKIF